MAIATGTETTYHVVGGREDLSDIIYRVAREETPVQSMCARGKATAVKHEWQKESLAAPDTTNARLEGDRKTTFDTSNRTSRLYNTCQISDKTASVSGTAEAINKAGRESELDRQKVVKGLELKRDVESIICQNQAQVAGDDTTARQLRSMEAWYTTNVQRGTGGANGSDSAAATDATTTNRRALTPSMIKTGARTAWEQGGRPSILLTSGTKKETISNFDLSATTAGALTRTQDMTDAKMVFGVDVVVTDFAKLRIVPSIHVRDRTVQGIEPDKWALAYLRNMKTEPLAKGGDATDVLIVCEYTLESRNEAASFVVADLT